MLTKPEIKNIDSSVLKSFLKENNQPQYRFEQICYWLFAQNISSFDQMTNIPTSLRNLLHANFTITNLKEHFKSTSADGSIRYVFKLSDGSLTESVLIDNDNRITACISSQVGCSLSCTFCATGYLKYKRNLSAAEIYEQVYFINQQSLIKFNKPLSNIVYMGMGEPFLNYNNVCQSIDYITSSTIGLGISPKRITISTAGISKVIKKLAVDKPKVNLAISLHAPNDDKRSKIMAINNSNTIQSLIEALHEYCHLTKNEFTIEYILFSNFNDSLQDAEQLIRICRKVHAKVNLIEYNPINNFSDLQPSSRNRIHYFQKTLIDHNIPTTIRYSKGKDISAACGQLSFNLQS